MSIDRHDLRFRPDTGEFEATSGLTQQGRARDDFGHWFGCHNSTFAYHYPLPDRYLARNPHVSAPPPSVNLAATLARLNPISTPLARCRMDRVMVYAKRYTDRWGDSGLAGMRPTFQKSMQRPLRSQSP